MTLYDQNISFLKKNVPGLLHLISAVPIVKSKLEPAKNGSFTLSYAQNNTPLYLHSRFNPQAESMKLIAKKNLNADHIVVMGLGLGYHLAQIIARKDTLTRVLLVEPEIEIIHQSMHTLDWSKLLARSDFHYAVGVDMATISETFQAFINIATLDKIEYIELPPETRILRGFFNKVQETLESEIKTALYDFKTRLAESYVVPRNVLNNLPYMLKSRPITHLRNLFKGTPGFIVSAGPSLDKNVLHLKKVKDRGLIVAVDTALKPLLARAVHPHFTAVGDPSHKNYLHLQGTEESIRHYIAAETGIAHRIYRDFHKQIFSLSIGKGIVRLLESHSQPLGEVEAWGSVISIALDFSIYMGLDPIVFVGQDFSFSGDRNHCRGTSWEENVIEYSADLAQLQRFENQSIAGNRMVIEAKDIYGKKIYTSERLTLYKNYLARMLTRYPETTFINATEGGIFTEIPAHNLYDVIKQYVSGKKSVDFKQLEAMPTMENQDNIKGLTAFMENKHDFFKDYLAQLHVIIKKLEKIETMDAEQLLNSFAESEKLHNLVYAQQENAELLEMWSAAPVYHFLKAYKATRHMQLNRETLLKNLKIFRTYFRNIKPLVKDMIKQFKRTSKYLASGGKRLLVKE